MNKSFLTAALAGLLTTGFVVSANAADTMDVTGKEKCYGVTKAGKNSCATASHSCAGHAAKDNEPHEWALVDKGTCEKSGGKLEAPKS